MTDTLSINRRRVPVSNPDKPLYPSGFTKREVVDYYVRIAPVMLTHLKGRTVTLKRYPHGAAGPFFFEKRCPPHKPGWVKTAPAMGRGSGVVEHCLLNDAAAIAWAANLAALELHVPLAKAAKPDRPTAVVFDLDPGLPATVIDAARLSLRVRDVLAHVGLQSFPKTSGGKGVHVYVPLNTPATFEQTKSFARAVADTFAKNDPAHITATMTRSLRPGKIFIDWSQNEQHKTTACPYTLRATDRPTVSTPVRWEEIENAADAQDATLLTFLAPDVIDRVQRLGDLFEPLALLKQRLPH